MGMKVYVNGQFIPEQKAGVSVFDHGLLYGDGVFEGIRAYNGRIFRLHEHLDRLYESAEAIALDVPMDREDFAELILNTCRENGLQDAYIRPIVTRGEGDLGIDPRKCGTPTVIVIARPVPPLYGVERYEKGLRLVTVTVRRNSPECLNPNIKSLNYLNNILGKIEANRRNADEGLFLDTHGYVSEATTENIFIVSDGVLATPPTHNNLRGVTRKAVIDLARELGLLIDEKPLRPPDVYNAAEVFITGTAAEVAPVVEVDKRAIGNGKPGPVTQQLMEAFRQYVRASGVPIYSEVEV